MTMKNITTGELSSLALIETMLQQLNDANQHFGQLEAVFSSIEADTESFENNEYRASGLARGGNTLSKTLSQQFLNYFDDAEKEMRRIKALSLAEGDALGESKQAEGEHTIDRCQDTIEDIDRLSQQELTGISSTLKLVVSSIESGLRSGDLSNIVDTLKSTHLKVDDFMSTIGIKARAAL